MDYKKEIAKWKLGSLYSFSNPHTMKNYKDAGFDCIEMILPSKEPITNFFANIRTKAETILNSIHDNNLELISLHLTYGKPWDISTRDTAARKLVIDTYTEIIPWIAKYGPKRLIIHASPSNVEPEERQERFHNCQESLGILSKLAGEYKLKIALENMKDDTSLGNCSDDIKSIIAPYPQIGVCCDMNHSIIEMTEEFLDRVGPLVCTVHVSDYDRKDERHVLPGKGVNNWQEILQLLVKHKYPGPFIYEVIGEDNVPKIIAENWKALKNG
ncbi:MAG: sugar phosphate isomerase/epimerase family protein [Elusimicrobiota bacterium]